MNEHCPDRSFLSRFHDGEVAEEELLRWKPHLGACDVCLNILSEYERTLPVSGEGEEFPPGFLSGLVHKGAAISGSPSDKVVFLPGWKRAAALLLVTTGIGAAVWAGSAALDRISQNHSISIETELALSGGTRVAWDAGSRFTAAEPGRFRLEQGVCRVTVPPGGSPVRIETPAGTVRSLGTVFSVQVFRYVSFCGGAPLSLTVTEVEEGAVEVHSGRTGRTVSGGMLGVLVQDLEPFLMEQSDPSASETDLLAELERTAVNDTPRLRLLEARLLSMGKRTPERFRPLFDRVDLQEEISEPLLWLSETLGWDL